MASGGPLHRVVTDFALGHSGNWSPRLGRNPPRGNGIPPASGTVLGAPRGSVAPTHTGSAGAASSFRPRQGRTSSPERQQQGSPLQSLSRIRG